MTGPEIFEYLGILLVAATKFVVATGYLLLPTSGFSYIETVLTLILGGSVGTLTFFYFSHILNKLINKILPKKKKEKKKFTKSSRRLITVKNKYGLYGIALIGPVILSIPVGSFLASRFYSKRKTTIFILLAGVVFWSLLLPTIKLLY